MQLKSQEGYKTWLDKKKLINNESYDKVYQSNIIGVRESILLSKLGNKTFGVTNCDEQQLLLQLLVLLISTLTN